jgi:hypothetical protein
MLVHVRPYTKAEYTQNTRVGGDSVFLNEMGNYLLQNYNTEISRKQYVLSSNVLLYSYVDNVHLQFCWFRRCFEGTAHKNPQKVK